MEKVEGERVAVIGVGAGTRRWIEQDGRVIDQEPVVLTWVRPSGVPCYRDPLTHEMMESRD